MVISSHSLSLLARRDWSTNSRGERPVSRAFENIDAASSSAPPKREPIVRRPEQSEETRSFPAREVTMVFIALNGSVRPMIAVYPANLPRDGGTMVGGQHEHHLDEFGSPFRKT